MNEILEIRTSDGEVTRVEFVNRRTAEIIWLPEHWSAPRHSNLEHPAGKTRIDEERGKQ
jgi:hypothetical protein